MLRYRCCSGLNLPTRLTVESSTATPRGNAAYSTLQNELPTVVGSSMKPLTILLGSVVLYSVSALRARAQQVAPSARAATAPLWGTLSPGPYAVGYREMFSIDSSRTWHSTRAYGQPFTPDLGGRPIRISVWYPATVPAGTHQMRYENYITMPAPFRFEELQTALESRDKTITRLSVPSDRVGDLLQTSVNAFANAAAAPGRFPLILYFGGLNDAVTVTSFVTAEYLASHGYVVAVGPLLGPTSDETDQALGSADIETTVRDMDFAWAILRNQQNVDVRKLGVAGHSLGGIEALLFAMRNADVSAVVGLDGTYGFAGSSVHLLTDAPGYSPRNMQAALLDLRRPDKNEGSTLDLSAVNAFHFSDRTLVTIQKVHHSDFTSFAMVAEVFHLGNSPDWIEKYGWTRETGSQGYQVVCNVVRDFFDETLKKDARAGKRLLADAMHASGPVVRNKPAIEAPPSVMEFAQIMKLHGFTAATSIVERLRLAAPDETVVKEGALNSFGYSLMSESHFTDAVNVLKLAAYVYPKSANAEDSLGDAYLAAGKRDEARRAYEKALALLPDDPGIDASGKKAFASTEQEKINKLGHSAAR
jgi:dienelactone hydrolase